MGAKPSDSGWPEQFGEPEKDGWGDLDRRASDPFETPRDDASEQSLPEATNPLEEDWLLVPDEEASIPEKPADVPPSDVPQPLGAASSAFTDFDDDVFSLSDEEARIPPAPERKIETALPPVEPRPESSSPPMHEIPRPASSVPEEEPLSWPTGIDGDITPRAPRRRSVLDDYGRERQPRPTSPVAVVLALAAGLLAIGFIVAGVSHMSSRRREVAPTPSSGYDYRDYSTHDYTPPSNTYQQPDTTNKPGWLDRLLGNSPQPKTPSYEPPSSTRRGGTPYWPSKSDPRNPDSSGRYTVGRPYRPSTGAPTPSTPRGYTPPSRPSYTPPSYTPPSYSPPSTPSYTPPSYTPPSTYP